MAELFETGMLICFGLSWPASIARSWRARSSKGKSVIFMLLIFLGYLMGIASKLLAGYFTYSVAFYILNLVLVGIDIGLYFRNARLDRIAEGE